jgi:hypothetical protein
MHIKRTVFGNGSANSRISKTHNSIFSMHNIIFLNKNISPAGI